MIRRNRRFNTQSKTWEPTMRNPYRGLVVWTTPEAIEINVTLFRNPKTNEFETKEYNLIIEDTTPNGRKRTIAYVILDLSQYSDALSTLPSRHELIKVPLQPLNKKVIEAFITLTVNCQFIKEGQST